MKGWRESERIDFNFYDAHDIRPLTDRASDETVRARLRERFSSAKQVIVLVGENTKSLHKFVRWEIEIALKLDLPVIAVNLNGARAQDDRCPALLRDKYVVHVPFKMKIIQYALDNFPVEYGKRSSSDHGPRRYGDDTYRSLGLQSPLNRLV
jgi:hypothetical protein